MSDMNGIYTRMSNTPIHLVPSRSQAACFGNKFDGPGSRRAHRKGNTNFRGSSGGCKFGIGMKDSLNSNGRENNGCRILHAK